MRNLLLLSFITIVYLFPGVSHASEPIGIANAEIMQPGSAAHGDMHLSDVQPLMFTSVKTEAETTAAFTSGLRPDDVLHQERVCQVVRSLKYLTCIFPYHFFW